MFDSQTVSFSKDTPLKDVVSHATGVLSKQLRDYQLKATLHAIAAAIRNKYPLLIEVPTGGGKSWICVSIAYMMSLIFKRYGHENRRTLIICPNNTLVEQNAEKLTRAGGDVAIFCASLKLKQTEGEIIVGTPVSIANSIDLFKDLNIGCVIVDEAHGHAGSSKTVVAALREQNPWLREFGMTATPYRTVEKYIFRVNSFDGLLPNKKEMAVEPYYDELVYRISGEELVEKGHLVPVLIQPIGKHYDTKLLKMGAKGKFTSESEREVFITKAVNVAIIADMLEVTKDRKMIMLFCQNIEHAEMVYEILNERLKEDPSLGTAALYHSKLDEDARYEDLKSFDAGGYRFLVSVRGLTTGYDNERIDAIVTLSTTESPGLYVQIVGRGMRPILTDRRFKKTHCRLYDYGENLQKHFPEGDLFKPFIRPAGRTVKSKAVFLQFNCPQCNHFNQAIGSSWYQPMKDAGYNIDQYGYFVSDEGDRLVCEVSQVPVAAHLRTTCQGIHEREDGSSSLCTHQWASQLCHECGVLSPNHLDTCHHCGADFKEKKLHEREGRPPMVKTDVPKPFAVHGAHRVFNARVDSFNVVFEKKKDKLNVEYLRGTLVLTLKNPTGVALVDGKIVFQKAINQTVKFHFEDHYDYVKASMQRKKMLMKALWGMQLTMDEAQKTPVSRKINRIEFYWQKSTRGFMFPVPLSLRTEAPKKTKAEQHLIKMQETSAVPDESGAAVTPT